MVLKVVYSFRVELLDFRTQNRGERISITRRKNDIFAVSCMLLILAISSSAEVQTAEPLTTPLSVNLTDLQPVAASKIVYPDPVSNLSVKAEVHDANKRHLVLLVSWNPPETGKPPLSYNLHVEPNILNDVVCKSLPYYKHIDDKDATNASVPEFVDVVHDFKVIPGCTYRIVVESNPHDGKKNTSLNYTVPECVAEVCSCRHGHGLPKPITLMAQVVGPHNVNVTWSLPPLGRGNAASHSNVTKFIVNFGPQVFKNRQLFNITPAGEVKYNSNGDLRSHHNLALTSPSDLRPNITYIVEVFVIDNRGCKGPETNYTFIIPAPTASPSASSLMLVTVLPVLTFAVVSILAVVMIWQRCGNWIRRKWGEGRLQPIHNWRSEYKAVSIGSETRITRSYPGLKETNVIYVEKEIEDARARGDADTFEVSYSRLELGREIGKGAFGRVFLARADAIAGIPGYMTVAVKKLKNKASADEVEEFLSEIAMLKRVGRHRNVVTMLGCCTLKQPYCMVMEYIPCGDLLQYLRQLRVEYERRTGGAFLISSTMQRPSPRYVDLQLPSTDSEGSYVQPETQLSSSIGRPSITETEWSLLSDGIPLTPSDLAPRRRRRLEYVLDPKELQDFAVQIARGMEHLEKKQITHRDLAARNVLIDEHKVLKISDFGLSRSGIYINTKRKKVPLRWLSVEAMRDNLYSSKSDVWAFAIVLWEIGTLGGFPYPTVSDMDLLNFLLEGKRLDKPDNCSDELFALMLHCWSHSADVRPSFAELVSHFESVIGRKRVYVDFSSLKPDYCFPPTEQQTQPHSVGKTSK